METIEILWTGGFDSTYRICELSKLKIKIMPYYLSDNRISEEYELNSIRKITKMLMNSPDTQCEFLPMEIYKSSDYANNPIIKSAYQRVYKNIFFGSQYNWLACFSQLHKGIELSIHIDDTAMKVIEKYGKLRNP